jgi:O-antigen ligase
VFLYYKNIFKIFVKAVLLCIVLYGLISFTQSKNIDNVVDEFATILIMDESNASNYFRLLEIDLVYTQVTANPLIGKGWGSRYDIYGVPQSTMEFMNDVNIVVHNSYLAIWFKTGLPGLLCFLFIVFMPLIQIVKLIIRNKLFENNYDMLLLCSGMIVVILFDFIIGPQIFHIRTTALAAIFYGLGIKMVGIHGRV